MEGVHSRAKMDDWMELWFAMVFTYIMSIMVVSKNTKENSRDHRLSKWGKPKMINERE